MKVEDLMVSGSCVLAQNKMEWYQDQMKNNNGLLWISSHYPQLDKHTSGIIPWKVYTIAWYSNVGKSRFAYWYINHFLDKWKSVAFFNLEVDKGMCFLNLCCNRYDKYNYQMKSEDIDIMDFEKLTLFDDIYNIDDIEQAVSLIKPDIVFIDFVQNINVFGASGYEAMATVAKKIQQMAIKNNATMFSLSQLSNSSAKDLSRGETDFVPLKWAGEFTASSDVILVLRMVEHKLWLTIVKTKYAQKPKEEIEFDCDFGRSKFAINKQSLPWLAF